MDVILDISPLVSYSSLHYPPLGGKRGIFEGSGESMEDIIALDSFLLAFWVVFSSNFSHLIWPQVLFPSPSPFRLKIPLLLALGAPKIRLALPTFLKMHFLCSPQLPCLCVWFVSCWDQTHTNAGMIRMIVFEYFKSHCAEECGIKSREVNGKIDFLYSFIHSTNLINPLLGPSIVLSMKQYSESSEQRELL